MDPNQPAPFGLMLLMDKPLEWTSFDVVNKLRYSAKHITGLKKIKVGHAGTLDPLASGLMIVCVGSFTKKIESLMGLPKQYSGTFMLGSTTPSYDLETAVDETFPLPKQDEGFLQSIGRQFVGTLEQIPPVYSAKKIDGQKAYNLARKGKEVNMKAAPIEITRFEIKMDRFPEISFVLDCSKGTYVRSLVHDFGRAAGSGAHLTSLRRTKIGTFSIDDAYNIDEAIPIIKAAYDRHKEEHSEKPL
jgi:tRNA pseudouridine55 synthase